LATKKFFDTNSLCLGAASQNQLFEAGRGRDDSANVTCREDGNRGPMVLTDAYEALPRGATSLLRNVAIAFSSECPSRTWSWMDGSR